MAIPAAFTSNIAATQTHPARKQSKRNSKNTKPAAKIKRLAAGFFVRFGESNSMTLSQIPYRTVPVVEPSTFLDEVVDLMQNEPLQTVVLVGDEQYMGLFNAAALADLVPPGARLGDLAVGPYVHPARVVGSPEMEAFVALELMERKNQSVLPVVEHRVGYKGVLTRDDIAQAQAQAQAL